MKYKLFLDDERLPKHVTWVSLPEGPWVIVRNYNEFVDYIDGNGVPSFVSFDHDLSLEHYPHTISGKLYLPKDISYDIYNEKTGYDCAKWLVDHCIQNKLNFSEYQVHSMNPIGKENIIKYIESYKRSLASLG